MGVSAQAAVFIPIDLPAGDYDSNSFGSMTADGGVVAGQASGPGPVIQVGGGPPIRTRRSEGFRWELGGAADEVSALTGGPGDGSTAGVTPDGRYLVGREGGRAYRWDRDAQQTVRSNLFFRTVSGVSDDGQRIVGNGGNNNFPRALVWDAPADAIDLGALSGDTGARVAGVSADGGVVFGGSRTQTTAQAYRWTEATGMVGLGFLPGDDRSGAFAASADGGVITGFSSSAGRAEAFVWTEAQGMIGLGDLPGGSFVSYPGAITPDGRIVVGYSIGDQQTDATPSGEEAFMWTAATGMVSLGDLPGGSTIARALGVSADGGVVVGTGNSNRGTEAFIWTPAEGMLNLKDALIAAGAGPALDGWRLSRASWVSDDGLVLAGQGTNPDGRSQAWVVLLPEPGVLTLLMLAGFGGLARRPQRR